jgi:hypothetical protein
MPILNTAVGILDKGRRSACYFNSVLGTFIPHQGALAGGHARNLPFQGHWSFYIFVKASATVRVRWGVENRKPVNRVSLPGKGEPIL